MWVGGLITMFSLPISVKRRGHAGNARIRTHKLMHPQVLTSRPPWHEWLTRYLSVTSLPSFIYITFNTILFPAHETHCGRSRRFFNIQYRYSVFFLVLESWHLKLFTFPFKVLIFDNLYFSSYQSWYLCVLSKWPEDYVTQ